MNGERKRLKNYFRKSLSLLLTLCLIAGMIPDAAFAQEDTGAVTAEATTEAASETAAEETGTAETQTEVSKAETEAETETSKAETEAAAETSKAETKAETEASKAETEAATEAAAAEAESGTGAAGTGTETETSASETEAAEEATKEETTGTANGLLTGTATCDHGNAADTCAVCEVEALIDELPTVDEIAEMDTDGQNEVYSQASAICDAYYELTEEEQEQVSNIDDLWDVLDYFSGGISTVEEDTGDFTVEGGVYGTDYSYADGTLTILSDTELTIYNTDSTTSTTNNIVVDSGVEANIILAGVNIVTSGNVQSTSTPLYMAKAGESTVTLSDGTENVLDASKTTGTNCPGLYAPNSYLLTITGSGELTAKGSFYWPGIGGDSSNNILIKDGIIKATGGTYGPGIGGSGQSSGGTITITGGTVIATGGVECAGIGGGRGANAKSIIISGGNIKALRRGSYSDYYSDSALRSNSYTITGGCFAYGDVDAETVNDISVADGYGVTDSRDTDYPYAVTANTYTVSFDAQEGTSETGSMDVTYGSAYGTLPEATRGGYTFAGWYTDTEANGGYLVTDETIVATAADHTLYAHWYCAHTSSYTYS